jgi:hypothetical protein
MKKIIKISYLYFATGIILCLYHFLSQEVPSLNIHDTYYVVSANHFAIFVALIYLILGIIFLVIERYLRIGIKVFQYLMFNIPFIYFLFSDITDYNPRLIFENPVLFKWLTIYIPLVLFYCFISSIILIFILFFFALWKWIKSNKASI